MYVEKLINFLERNADFDLESLKELDDLKTEFPYFQTAHLLYTKNLKEVKDSRYHSQLRITAAYIRDRRQLFYQLEDEFSFLFNKEKSKKAETHSSFSLIESFLSKNENKYSTKDLPEKSDRALISSDYVSYLTLEKDTTDENVNNEFIPFSNQATIDKYLEEDKKSPIKITFEGNYEEIGTVFPEDDMDEKDSFFSETLAKIYIKQKKYEKALEIIRKLSLIYPEKNRYFADQIRFLEKLIINEKNKI